MRLLEEPDWLQNSFVTGFTNFTVVKKFYFVRITQSFQDNHVRIKRSYVPYKIVIVNSQIFLFSRRASWTFSFALAPINFRKVQLTWLRNTWNEAGPNFSTSLECDCETLKIRFGVGCRCAGGSLLKGLPRLWEPVCSQRWAVGLGKRREATITPSSAFSLGFLADAAVRASLSPRPGDTPCPPESFPLAFPSHVCPFLIALLSLHQGRAMLYILLFLRIDYGVFHLLGSIFAVLRLQWGKFILHVPIWVGVRICGSTAK